jgi:hypothetical protein
MLRIASFPVKMLTLCNKFSTGPSSVCHQRELCPRMLMGLSDCYKVTSGRIPLQSPRRASLMFEYWSWAFLHCCSHSMRLSVRSKYITESHKRDNTNLTR